MNGSHWTLLVVSLDWVIRLGLILRAIMRRLQVGVSLAWMAVILGFPFLGTGIYLLFGERRLGRMRADRARELHEPYASWLAEFRSRYLEAESRLLPTDLTMARLVNNGSGQPVLPDNALELIPGADLFFERLEADVKAASRSCHLEFYIWSAGGRADALHQALAQAAAHGVRCRVLVDALGSASFLRSPEAAALRSSGVDLRAALPVNLIQGLFRRLDLRLHRKIVVIDGLVGYTGSQNIADPRFFKQNSGVGEWIDAMVRVTGPAVEALAVTFVEDWELETDQGLQSLSETLVDDIQTRGSSLVQVIPSGPNLPRDRMETLIIQSIYDATQEIVLTTPYYVPSESMVEELLAAALRGVVVILVVPAKIDSKLVNLASRAFQGDLADAGVKLALFEGGLLHTKSITIDGRRSLFGSLNLDPRSLQLNFEITLAVYDVSFTKSLRALQQTYLDRSTLLDLDAWKKRPFLLRFAENSARLLGPVI